MEYHRGDEFHHTKVSQNLISKVTDAVSDDVKFRC